MKKITLLLIVLGSFLTANAQYVFNPIVGPTNVAEGSPVTINVNDVANASGVPASSTGSYNAFTITAEWSAGGGGPWSSEADLTFTTTAGSITIDPPTEGGASSAADTTITFSGEMAGAYDPTTDGFLDIVLNQSYGGSDADWSNIEVTLFESPTCIAPTGMETANLISDSVDLSWTAGDAETSWNIEYNSAEDFTPGNGEAETTTTAGPAPTLSLTGLSSDTTYYVYYQADCSGDLSTFSGPFIFTTLCDVVVPDYLENFSTITPSCWEEADSGDATTGPSDLGNSSWTTDGFLNNGFTGAYKINLWVASKSDWIISPQFDLTGGPFQVEFDFAIMQFGSSTNAGTLGSDDTVQLLMTTDNGASWITLLTYDSSSVLPNTGIHPIVDLTAYSGQTVQFAILGSEGTVNDPQDNDVFVDNFQVRNIPTCPEPLELAADNFTPDGADLSWTEAGTSTVWNVEIVPAGTDPTGTPTATNVSNPYTVTGLDPITEYDFYVQADCGGDLSSFSGPFTFTTLCDVFTPDYLEDFATIIPDCWDEADSGDATTGPSDFGNSSWTTDGFLNNGFTGAYKINLWVASKSDWIISPQFDLTGGPFQVEFDFGIMEFGSDDTAGTLGSDDTVQLLMTNDDGATWITLLTYDASSVVPATGIHPVVDLTAYSGQIVQFAILGSEGTVNDPQDNDVFVDNFQVRNIPTCPEPSDLAATNLSLTSTEVSWTETGTSTSWNIQYGEAGFELGTGTIEAEVNTNPYILTDLSSDTSYEFYVQAICGPGDESSWTGPFQFFTGYCESIPSSNDGEGVNAVTIGIEEFISFGDETYENHTTPAVNVFQGIETTVEIEFGHTFTYDVNIWIDFNDDLVFDASELVFQGESVGGDNPHLMNASFTMPATATIGEHRMRIGSADFGQSTPNPCYSGSWGVTLDFTVNIQELLCTLPEATFTTAADCEAEAFFIDVDISSVGDASSLEISNNFDSETIQALNADTYQAGPFPFGTAVRVFVTNEQDTNCVISSETFEVLACPPSNDECVDATVALVNEDSTCDVTTAGTILAATPSGVDPGSCTGSTNDDVWFQFTASNEVSIISINNIVGGTSNLDHAVYEGSCGTLTELYCSGATSSVTPELVVDNTYYVRIFSGGSQLETSTFDLCIRSAPSNTICGNAENFCSEGGALTSPNVIGIPDPNPIACLGTAPNPTWNIIQIGESGPIEIEISQENENGLGLDVDFVVWGPFESVEDACINIAFEDCPECPFSNNPDTGFYPFGNIVDCSYSGAAVENLSIDDAQAGEIYMLLVTNFNGGPGTITIEQTNAGGTDNGTIEAEISADITSNEVVFVDTDDDPSTPVEASVCGFESVTIEADSPFADEYVWYQDGFVMEGETSSTLVVTESSNYQVQAFDSQCGSEAFSPIVIINLYLDAGNIEPQTLTSCDGIDLDGAADFDLEALSTSLGLGEDFLISYYTNPDDANQAMNAVSSPYNSSGETLVMRIEDVEASNDNFLGCRSISSVELIVNATPSVNQPEPFIVCDDIDGTVDGVTEFDLTSIDPEINTDTDVAISYHSSQENAENGTSPISSPYSSGGETIFVRAENTTTGCFNTTSFDLEVNIVPLASFDQEVEYLVCPNATSPIQIGITPSNFDASEVSVNWLLDGEPIAGGNGLTFDNVLVQGDYTAEITFNATGCVNTVTQFVEELETCVIPEGISPGVSPGVNDVFDLSSYNVTRLEIFNRYGTLVYSKNNYVNEWEGQTNDGKELPVGTYFYTMVYEGGTKKRSAWIYINR